MQISKHQPSLTPIHIAIESMLAACTTVPPKELVDVMNAHNRVLAETITSHIDVPNKHNSAMDGYCFAVQQEVAPDTEFIVVGKSLAGHPYSSVLHEGECVRITTGATLPEGANTVEMQENVVSDSDDNVSTTPHKIRLSQPVRQGQNVRYAGEDIKHGQALMEVGRKLCAADLALIASVGIQSVEVFQKITVAVIATGDELIQPGLPLAEGQIYESNRYALQGLLNDLHVNVLQMGIVEDTITAITDAFECASQKADLIISCGGVSVGDADYVKQVLNTAGEVNFWKVAIKPGKPFAFGHIHQTLFCGLPGNPVSSFVTCEQLVAPLIAKLQGTVFKRRTIVSAKCASKIYKRPGRADFQRGVYFQNDDGQFIVEAKGKQGSGIMTSLSDANCYILLDIDQGNLNSGDTVKIELF